MPQSAHPGEGLLFGAACSFAELWADASACERENRGCDSQLSHTLTHRHASTCAAVLGGCDGQGCLSVRLQA